jgi:hypothetical protein
LLKAGNHQRRIFIMHNRNVIFGAILWALAFLPEAQAVRPAPDGCYPNFTTAEGCNALNAVSIGIGNTGVGSYSLFSNTTGNFNTAIGTVALALNNADNNTAVGTRALLLNTVGHENTAVGANALLNNDTGTFNNAFGSSALLSNTTGAFNNVHGRNVLVDNVDGSENNAFGDLALENNTSGSANTAVGDDALRSNVDGSGNVAIGDEAGTGLGISVNNCIAIGAPGDGPFATHDNTCFIGSIFAQPVSDPGTQVAVFVDQFNNVGVFNSSRRFKHDIQPMDNASETLYGLNPVTFKFNSDCKGTTQYGLIAEEVAKVDPQLVVRGKNGEVQTVHYEQINSMLLNEFLKEHKKVEELQNTVAQQQKGMEALTAQLKEQAAQVQKVCAQLEMSQSATKMVVNEP